MQFYFRIFFYFASIALLTQFTNVDLFISDLFLNHNHRFYLQANKALGIALHDYPKYVAILIGLLFWSSAVGIILFNKNILKNFFQKKEVLYVSLAAILIPVIIWYIRDFSAMHCPRELIRYGGEFEYLRIFDSIPALWSKGQCSPSAHASSFLWLLAIPILKKNHLMLKTLSVFIFILCFVQVLRGAHFVSHICYSFLIAYLVLEITYIVFKKLK